MSLSWGGATHSAGWLRVIMAVVLWCAAPVWLGAQALADAPIEFLHAEFTQSAQSAQSGKGDPLLLPPSTAEWQQVDLPDSWRRQQRKRSAIGWYRLRFSLPAVPPEPLAIYIPRITNNVAIFLNGRLLGVSGNIGQREISWNVAQYFLISPGLLTVGPNVIEIRLHPDRFSRAGLSRVFLGGERDIRPLFQWRQFLQTTAPQFISALLGVMAAFALAIWANRRKETMFVFFGLMCLVAMIRLAHFYVRDSSIPLFYVTDASICWMSALTASFMLHFAGRPLPWFEKFLYGYAAIATLALWFAPAGFGRYVVTGVFAMMGLISIAMIWYVGRALLATRSFANIVMWVGLVLNVALGIHDFLNYQELLGFDHLYLLPLGLPLVLFGVAALVVTRFTGTLANYETLHGELAHRVGDRERDLALSYEKLRVLDQQRTTAEERQRLMRDMHDGIGSHLMSTLALARMGTLTQHDMQEVLADCIDELKITIDSLEPVESDLLVVLGNLRYRLEPRLKTAGISLEWAVSDLPPLAYLDPENTRSILRIVQEAFTNTLKHAEAHRITLSTGVDYNNARVWVRLTDDGVGFNPGQKSGRGVENMKSRAAKLNGDVEVVPLKGGGTCVNLYLPLAKMR